MKKVLTHIDSFFKISNRNSTISKEIIGGILIFFAMIYILPVNSSILENMGGEMTTGAIFAATAICTGIGCLLMGFLGNFPVALSSGMGLNAYVAFTICGTLGYSWQEGLAIVLVSGIIFFILTLTPIRQWIVNAIPRSLKYAMVAGLGAFICFVGLKMGGIIIDSDSTFVALNSFDPTGGNGYALLALGGVLLGFALLAVPNVYIRKFSILIAMITVGIIGLILNQCGVENMPTFTVDTGQISDIGNVFGKGFASIPSILAKPQTYAVIFSLVFVHLFSTTATLISVGEQAGIVDKKTGKMPNSKRIFIADATGSLLSGIVGTSTVIPFVESTVGVESGARTGLSTIITGLLFLLSLAIFPAFNVFAGIQIDGNIYTPVTCLALVTVGAMMFSNLRHIDWNDKIIVFSSFITFIIIILSYSLTNGVALGLIFYALMMLCSGKAKKVSPIIYVLAVFFAISLVLTAVLNHIGDNTPVAIIQSIAPYLPITNIIK